MGEGLIPAGAGRTARRTPTSTWERAHPRWRGADVRAHEDAARFKGSSPLARGGQCGSGGRAGPPGLIPAGAGRTDRPALACKRCGAHPRWRGADTAIPVIVVKGGGSSPLARGGLRLPAHQTDRVGLIPAGAGRTASPVASWASVWAHPRWRGADRVSSHARSVGWGSSPLARGGRAIRRPRSLREGLIPAGAGRTCAASTTTPPTRAHPRWRGADDEACGGRGAAEGSSPLARGGLGGGAGEGRRDGLIPAGAGRTPDYQLPIYKYGAHPRWRGADSSASIGSSAAAGSSPLARGGLGRLHGRRLLQRLIPAGAGRTLADLHGC